MSKAQGCFHCGEPIPSEIRLTVTVDDIEQPVCCHGCQAVASTIVGAGLDAFYQFRPEPTGRPEDAVHGNPERYRTFDEARVQQEFVHRDAAGQCETSLLVEGLYCAACGWLIERSLADAPGVEEVRVNPATGRALLRWDPAKVQLSRLMAHMGRLGYKPHPVLPETTDSQAVRERRSALRRLIVAGLGMMQAMMFAVGLYFGQYQGMDEEYVQFLRLVSMLVATPVVLYAGLPIFLGAIRDLRNLRPGMDVPVSLAIGTGYGASVWITFMGGPEVYFDSISMFTFFLLVARYVEMAARHRANATSDALARLVPATALRLRSDGSEEEVPSRELQPGDRVLIRPGATIPADGVVLRGCSSVDESMLTGESDPRARGVDSAVVGGSLNIDDSLEVRIEKVGQETMASHIGRLLRRAQAERPSLARLADTVGRWFVTVVLFASATVFAIWWHLDPALAFPITLAMLIATCPCALSLATPTALAAGTNRLAGDGLLITRADAVETLARVTHVVLDKTGTLTEGRLSVLEARTLDERASVDSRRIAAALEQHSEHPIARAFRLDGPLPDAESVSIQRGAGVEGQVDGRQYRLGRPDWVSALPGTAPLEEYSQGPWVLLGDSDGPIAAFRIADRLRPEAVEAVAAIRARGIEVEIASGDAPEPVREAAQLLGITQWQARMTPEDKLVRLRSLQDEKAVVLMVGDGINDAPVLAGANVSAALNEGTALAQTSAGMILLGGQLDRIARGLDTARHTLRVIRQNLVLSATYNASMLPMAAMGFVPPWLAAIGMTLSSVVVVMNARRLARPARRPHVRSAPTPALAGGSA
ncbi:MAG: cadmium-translocating P-type ATPase [Ectothiorhodospiraceae bacterium]|nr:cadmium-translocating P-type ATPase [Ectothiorhodospiraceae bacterium]MCH8503156.1 cadmium-translocating P-type ATPase [Ectothiorhodospiraceae bacterium]